jgi:hypothetical protein
MIKLITSWLFLPLCASPGNTMFDLLMAANNWSVDRRARTLTPTYMADDEPVEKPSGPELPDPTDVPVPDPHDVPVHEPTDIPPPDPGASN